METTVEAPPKAPATEAKFKYTTQEHLAEYNELVGKIFSRKSARDKSSYEVTNIFPAWTPGQTGTDLVKIQSGNAERLVYPYCVRLTVEEFGMEYPQDSAGRIKQKEEKIRVSKGTFHLDASEFVEKFEREE